MKNLLVAASSVLIATSTLAEVTLPQEIDTSVTTLEDMSKAKGGTWIKIKGYLIKQLSPNEFVFKDTLGDTINIHLQREYLAGHTPRENTLIEITARVSRIPFEKNSIDVEDLNYLN